MIKIKKKLTVLMILLSFTLLLMGCSSSKSSTADVEDKSAAQTTSNSSKTTGSDAKTSNIFGEVESISGNKLTIAIAKQPEQSAKPSQDGNTQGQPPQGGNAPSTQETGGNSGSGADRPTPGSGGTAPQMELTGEKQVVIVADDTSIASMSRGNPQENTTNTANTTELKLTDIKAGTIVRITLKADSTDTEKTASAIRVMKSPSN